MLDIYKEIELLIEDLKTYKYDEYAQHIKNAKLSGSIGSEILGLVLEELKRYPEFLNESDVALKNRIEKLKLEISISLKLRMK